MSSELTVCIHLILATLEVEQLIESATQAVVTSSPSLELRRDILVDKLVRILENDLTWVERYETTGELLLPEDASIGEETEECLPQLRDVGNLICHLIYDTHSFT